MKKITKFLIAAMFAVTLIPSTGVAQENVSVVQPNVLGFKLYDKVWQHKKQCRRHHGKWKIVANQRYSCDDMNTGFRVNLVTDEHNQVMMMVFAFASEEYGRSLFYKVLNNWVSKAENDYQEQNNTHYFNVDFWTAQFSEPLNVKGTHSVHLYDLNFVMSL